MKEWSHEAKQKRFGLGTKAFGFQGSGFGGEEVQVLGGGSGPLTGFYTCIPTQVFVCI